MSEINLVQNVLLHLARYQQGPARSTNAGFVLLAENLPPGLRAGDRLTVTVLPSAPGTLVIEVQGQPVPVQAPGAELPPGTQLPVRVVALTPQAILQVEPTPTPSAPLSALQPGQVITATVQEQLVGGGVQIDLQGISVQAEAPDGLHPGTRLTLTVEQSSPQLVLRIVDQQPSIDREAVSLLRSHIGARVLVGESLTALRTTIAQLTSTTASARSTPVASTNLTPPVTLSATGSAPVRTQPALPGDAIRGQAALSEPGPPPRSSPLSSGPTPAAIASASALPASTSEAVVRPSPEALAAPAQSQTTVLPAANKPLPPMVGPAFSQPMASQPTPFPGSLTSATPLLSTSVLPRLQQVLHVLVPERGPPAPEWLAAFVRDGGLHFEAKLAEAILRGDSPETVTRLLQTDLKGLLLRTLAEVQMLAVEQAQPLLDSVGQHLAHIETQQALNLLAQLQREPFQLQIPLVLGNQLTTAALLIERDRSDFPAEAEERRAAGCNVLFLLDLDHLGELRIDARFTEQALGAVFYIQRGDLVEWWRTELSAFRKTLLGMGYAEVFLDAKPLNQLAPQKQPQFAALAANLPQSVHVVDLRA